MGARALVGRRGAREQAPRDARSIEQGPQLLGVLRRQDGGGRHHGGLGAGVCRGGQGHGGDGRLARADVSEQQAVHDVRGGHVGQDLVHGLALLGREREGQRRREGVQVRPVGHVGGWRHALELHALAGEKGHLQAEQLVVGKPAPGALRGRHAGGKVHLPQGAAEAHEGVVGHQARGHPVADVAHVGQGGRDHAAHPRQGDALPHRMDRQNASVRGSLVRRAKDLVEGGLHLLEPIREGHPAGERDGVSDLDLLGNPRLAEERGHEEARLVHHCELDDLHVGARTLELDLVHAADHRGVLPHVREGDLAHAAEVKVAVGHVQQQVTDARDAQALQGLRPQGRDKPQPRHRVREGAGSLHPL